MKNRFNVCVEKFGKRDQLFTKQMQTHCQQQLRSVHSQVEYMSTNGGQCADHCLTHIKIKQQQLSLMKSITQVRGN